MVSCGVDKTFLYSFSSISLCLVPGGAVLHRTGSQWVGGWHECTCIECSVALNIGWLSFIALFSWTSISQTLFNHMKAECTIQPLQVVVHRTFASHVDPAR